MSAIRLAAIATIAAILTAACAPATAAPTAPRIASRVTTRISTTLFTQSPAAMQFVTPEVGYVLRSATAYQTGGGTLQVTADAARTWRTIQLPAGLHYGGMHFFSGSTGILTASNTACDLAQPGCEGVVLWTGDGGRTFRTVLRVRNQLFGASTSWSATAGWLAASPMCFSSACQTQSLYGTSDGGRSWTRIWTARSPNGIAQLATSNGLSGYAVVGGNLLRTADGGRSWQTLGTLPSGAHRPIQAMGGSLQTLPGGTMYLSACDGLDVGNGGCGNYLYRSTDGGAAFQTVWSRYCTDATAMHMQTPLSGVLVLMGTPACGARGIQGSNIVLSTTNGFRSVTLAYAFPATIDGVQFTGAESGWADGTGQYCGNGACPTVIYRTTDGGYRWTEVSAAQTPFGALAAAPGGGYYGVGTALDPNALVASGSGASWHVVGHLPRGAASFGFGPALQMVGRAQGYLTIGGSLWRMADGGKAFARIPVPKQETVVAVSFVTQDYGYVLTQAGKFCPDSARCRYTLLTTGDAGRSFSSRRLPKSLQLWSIAFASRQVGYAAALCPVGKKCGQGVRLYRTTDGGATWRLLSARLGLTGSPVMYTAPHGYIAVVAGNGFAVLQPGIGWRIVRTAPRPVSPPSPYAPVVYADVAAIAPGPASALVILPGAGLFTAPYTAPAWRPVGKP